MQAKHQLQNLNLTFHPNRQKLHNQLTCPEHLRSVESSDRFMINHLQELTDLLVDGNYSRGTERLGIGAGKKVEAMGFSPCTG
jgi:hypothetical protein